MKKICVDDKFVLQQQHTKKSSSGVIYWLKCDRVDCEDEYIGESSRTFGE